MFWSGFSFVSLWLEDRHYNDAHVAEACATPLQLASVVYSRRITVWTSGGGKPAFKQPQLTLIGAETLASTKKHFQTNFHNFLQSFT